MGENMEKESPPLLLISHGHSLYDKHSTYDLLENSCRFLGNIPILCNKRVFGSSYGWLALVDVEVDDDRKGKCCLWNPMSMDIIQLPLLDRPYVCNQFILSKPPTESGCYILFNSMMEQSFCQIGDTEFVKLGKKEDGNVRVLLAIGFFQSKIYGLMNPGHKFVTIDFVGQTLEFTPIMVVDELCRCSLLSPMFLKHFYLIESPRSSDDGCGVVELLIVHKIYVSWLSSSGVDFRVFRLDTNQMTCIELDNIGNRAIFLSHAEGGFCCFSSRKIKPNSIYYTDEYGRSVHVFDLEDGSTTSMLPSRSIGYRSISSWVQPQLFHNHIH
ncbi:hypothetical protein ACP275_03G090700 [Erythranthe tilingii]